MIGTKSGNATQLRAYTGAVLNQMVAAVRPYVVGDATPFQDHVGPHLRHIIEHFEALSNALSQSAPGLAEPCVVDYDARVRDRRAETDPAFALQRIQRLERTFCDATRITDHTLDKPLEVHTRGGLQGEHDFSTASSLARELMFLNSHATHHFAILQAYLHQRGLTLGDGVGKAPATVAHEQKQTPPRELVNV